MMYLIFDTTEEFLQVNAIMDANFHYPNINTEAYAHPIITIDDKYAMIIREEAVQYLTSEQQHSLVDSIILSQYDLEGKKNVRTE